MAGFDKEFRPDKTDAGLLHKLYITKKQRLSLLKWTLYGVILLILSVLQDVLLSRIDIYGATTDLVPCAILTVCIVEDVENGSVFGLIASFLYLFSGAAPGYHVVALITALGVGAGIFRQSLLQKGLGSTLLCAGTCVMLYEMGIFLVALVFGQTALSRFAVALITGGLSVLLIPLLYPAFVSISKIGGESWKE